MNSFDNPILLPVLIVLLLISIYFTNQENRNVIRYDCRIAEVAPEYPAEVKEACRQRRPQLRKEK